MTINVPSYSLSASSRTSRLCRSRWLVGSSSRSRLPGSIISLASARRAFSPPESTAMRLSTSSPVNRKQPRSLRNSRRSRPGAACSISSSNGVRGVEIVELVLGVVATPHVVPQLEPAAVGFEAPGEQLEQRRLARTVGTGQRQPIPASQDQLQSVVDRLGAETLDQSLSTGHDVAGSGNGLEAEGHPPRCPLGPHALELVQGRGCVTGPGGPWCSCSESAR